MDTQLDALPTLAVLARTVSGCLNSAFLDISQHFTGYLFRPWIPNSARHRRRTPTIHRGRAQRTISAVSLDGIGPGTRQGRALAGLGRGGDASCVPVILAAIRDAAPPTFQVGMDALRALPGEDVTRALIVAYPKLPSRAQLALIPVLGASATPWSCRSWNNSRDRSRRKPASPRLRRLEILTV